MTSTMTPGAPQPSAPASMTDLDRAAVHVSAVDAAYRAADGILPYRNAKKRDVVVVRNEMLNAIWAARSAFPYGDVTHAPQPRDMASSIASLAAANAQLESIKASRENRMVRLGLAGVAASGDSIDQDPEFRRLLSELEVASPDREDGKHMQARYDQCRDAFITYLDRHLVTASTAAPVPFYRRSANDLWRETTAEHIAHLKQFPGEAYEYGIVFPGAAAAGSAAADSTVTDTDDFGSMLDMFAKRPDAINKQAILNAVQLAVADGASAQSSVAPTSQSKPISTFEHLHAAAKACDARGLPINADELRSLANDLFYDRVIHQATSTGEKT